MRDVVTCLWYPGTAEEATALYADVIADARIVDTVRIADPALGAAGDVLTVLFEIKGQRYLALNGGPQYALSPAVSIQLICDTQDEVDALWDGLLSGGGQESMCGWLVDRYGLSWQVTPARLLELMADPDPGRATRVSQAMQTMRKIDIAALEEAAARLPA